jgi:hypothetical protein
MDALKATKKALIILLPYHNYYSEKALSPYVAALRKRTINNTNNKKHYIGTGTSST